MTDHGHAPGRPIAMHRAQVPHELPKLVEGDLIDEVGQHHSIVQEVRGNGVPARQPHPHRHGGEYEGCPPPTPWPSGRVLTVLRPPRGGHG